MYAVDVLLGTFKETYTDGLTMEEKKNGVRKRPRQFKVSELDLQAPSGLRLDPCTPIATKTFLDIGRKTLQSNNKQRT
jgi:hypothetical protein